MAIWNHDHAACSDKRRRLIACTSLLLFCPTVARAIDYPTRYVTIIVPFPPGGSTDLQGRLIAKGLSDRLGKPVIVENHAGAGGELGAGIAARAAADGYTLLLATIPNAVNATP